MTPRELWERYKALLFDDPDLGLRLDLSRAGLGEAALAEREASMQAAFAAMEALERGAIANPDENRMVGHYWLRAPEGAPAPEIAAAIRDTRARVLDFASRVHDGRVKPPGAERFRHLLVVGIGGSALGPQLVADALGGPGERLSPHFLDNTDPDGIDRVLSPPGRRPRRRRSPWSSPSPAAPPRPATAWWRRRPPTGRAALDFAAHAVAITQEGSTLDRQARDQGFLARFPMWDWVGGRTSVTSAVGLLPAALQGIDVRSLLEGAGAMDAATRRHETRRNPAALLALAWHAVGEGRGSKAMVVLPYKDRLLLFSRYLQQLVMESIGKEKDLDGPRRPPGAGRLRQQGLDGPARLRPAAARRDAGLLRHLRAGAQGPGGSEPRGRAGGDERGLPRRLPARDATGALRERAAPRSRSRSRT